MGKEELIARRIRYFCRLKKLTYCDLAERSAVPLPTLKRIMSGATKNPGVVTIGKICMGLGITIAEFFSSEEFKNIEFEVE